MRVDPLLSASEPSMRSIDESRPPPSRVRENGPDAGGDKIRLKGPSMRVNPLLPASKKMVCTKISHAREDAAMNFRNGG